MARLEVGLCPDLRMVPAIPRGRGSGWGPRSRPPPRLVRRCPPASRGLRPRACGNGRASLTVLLQFGIRRPSPSRRATGTIVDYRCRAARQVSTVRLRDLSTSVARGSASRRRLSSVPTDSGLDGIPNCAGRSRVLVRFPHARGRSHRTSGGPPPTSGSRAAARSLDPDLVEYPQAPSSISTKEHPRRAISLVSAARAVYFQLRARLRCSRSTRPYPRPHPRQRLRVIAGTRQPTILFMTPDDSSSSSAFPLNASRSLPGCRGRRAAAGDRHRITVRRSRRSAIVGYLV